MNGTDMVGPVLEACGDAQAIVAAIRALNANVSVQNRGAYLRVRVPQRCEVTRIAIEAAAGKEFRLPQDLERVMPAFSGLLSMDDEKAVWLFREPA